MASVIYMDNQATTRVDPRVVDVMLPYFSEKFGNAASRSHQYGWEAEEAVDTSRKQIASAINGQSKDIIFTSGATESDNLAIKGVLEFHASKGKHVITAATEHNAVLDTCKALSKAGLAEVTVLPVDEDGFVDPADVRSAIIDETVLISVMHVNNEIGTIAPLAEIGAVAKECGVLFHTDATQAVGKIPVDVEAMGIDLLSLTAHKMYGPKGAGALYVRSKAPRVRLSSMIHGGGHERGMRSGTLNVPGIVGLGTACAIAGQEMQAEGARLTDLRQRLRDGLLSQIDDARVNGPWEKRLPGNLHMSFAYVEGESLLMGLRDVALSSGSACTSATLEPSHVLRAIGVRDELAHNSLRFGLGRFNTREDVDHVIERVVEEVRRLRALSPMARAGRRTQAG